MSEYDLEFHRNKLNSEELKSLFNRIHKEIITALPGVEVKFTKSRISYLIGGLKVGNLTSQKRAVKICSNSLRSNGRVEYNWDKYQDNDADISEKIEQMQDYLKVKTSEE